MSPIRKRAFSATLDLFPSNGFSDPRFSGLFEATLPISQGHGGVRRAQSLPFDVDASDHGHYELLELESEVTITQAVVQANCKRRMSAVQTTRNNISEPQRAHSRIPSHQSSEEDRGSSYGKECSRSAAQDSDSTLAEDSQESEENEQRPYSRGWARRRNSTPFPMAPETQLDCSSSSVTRLRKQTSQSRLRNSVVEPRSGSNERSKRQTTDLRTISMSPKKNKQIPQSHRSAKGAFLVAATPGKEEYRFPVPSSKPEPSWRAGDGFSSDEANPDFVFYVTGHKKRERPCLMPGFGQLVTGPADEQNGRIRDSRKQVRTRQLSRFRQTGLLRGAAKDEWPTYDDFVNGTLSVRTNQLSMQVSHDSIRSTMEDHPPQAVALHEPRPTLKYVSKRRRHLLDFDGLNCIIEPQGQSTYSSAMLHVRATRMSSPLQEPGKDMNMDVEETSSTESITRETGYSLASSDEDVSSSDHSDVSLCSQWDEHGNHLYVDNIRSLKRQRRHYSDEEGLDDEENMVHDYSQEKLDEESDLSQESN